MIFYKSLGVVRGGTQRCALSLPARIFGTDGRVAVAGSVLVIA